MSIAVFTANFVTVRGVLAPLFRIVSPQIRIELYRYHSAMHLFLFLGSDTQLKSILVKY